MLEDLYSRLMLEPLHDPHVRLSVLLKSCLSQCLSIVIVYSHTLGPAEKRRTLSLLKVSLLTARNGILAPLEKR